MNPYQKMSDLTAGCEEPRWTECEVIGGCPPGLEIRKARDGFLVSIDSAEVLHKSIEPGDKMTLSFTSPIGWKAKHFSVSAECAHRFLLTSLRCALIEYVPNHPIACTILSDAACIECRAPRAKRYLPTEWPTVMPGLTFEFGLENISETPAHFRATFEADRLPHMPIF